MQTIRFPWSVPQPGFDLRHSAGYAKARAGFGFSCRCPILPIGVHSLAWLLRPSDDSSVFLDGSRASALQPSQLVGDLKATLVSAGSPLSQDSREARKISSRFLLQSCHVRE